MLRAPDEPVQHLSGRTRVRRSSDMPSRGRSNTPVQHGDCPDRQHGDGALEQPTGGALDQSRGALEQRRGEVCERSRDRELR